MIINDPNENKIQRIIQVLESEGSLSDQPRRYEKHHGGVQENITNWDQLVRLVSSEGPTRWNTKIPIDESIKSLNDWYLREALGSPAPREYSPNEIDIHVDNLKGMRRASNKYNEGGGFDLPVLSALINLIKHGSWKKPQEDKEQRALDDLNKLF